MFSDLAIKYAVCCVEASAMPTSSVTVATKEVPVLAREAKGTWAKADIPNIRQPSKPSRLAQ